MLGSHGVAMEFSPSEIRIDILLSILGGAFWITNDGWLLILFISISGVEINSPKMPGESDG